MVIIVEGGVGADVGVREVGTREVDGTRELAGGRLGKFSELRLEALPCQSQGCLEDEFLF